MRDEDEPKVWKLEGELAVESGAELMQKLEELGVGVGVLAVGLAKFTLNDEGQMEVDVPAEKVAKAYFKSRYAGDLTESEILAGVVGDDVHVCDHHKQMVKQVCETGGYVQPAEKAVRLADRFKGMSRFKKGTAQPSEQKSKQDEKKVKAEVK